MSDRLPQPMAETLQPAAAERASAMLGGGSPTSPARASVGLRSRPDGLHALQSWMIEAITGPEELDSRGIVTAGPRQSERDRLHIYRHGYTARLSECLRDDYPALAASLGDEKFEQLCREYIARYPSNSPSLNAFGRHMAQLCASSTLLEAGPFCADLARLEWALVEVTHAEAPVPLDLTELQRIPPEAWSSARLIPSDTLRLLVFDYPVNPHYQAYRARGIVQQLPAAARSATAVYRRDLALWRMDLTPAMTRVLQSLLAGETIPQALSQIGVDERDPSAIAEAERSIMTWFRSWVESAFFARLTIDPAAA